MRKHKQHILYIVIVAILLGLITINNGSNVSALNYSSSVGVGFTFNPTLSVSISPSDLVIANLVPGNTLDSNVINVSVASNATYGYTLSAIVNGNNSNLTHSNGTNIFSSIDTNANLSNLEDSEDTNIWGYSTSLDSGTTWSDYNGLSNSNNTALINTNSNTSSNLDFKIAAKASSTQASGTYTGTINFVAVSNVAPMSLLDSFIASGAEQLNGYFKMQDMTHDICESVDIEESELQLIDVRDNKVYWVAKLKDGNCWMTQNLELDLVANSTILNSTNTDIDVESYNSESGAYSPAGGYSKDNNTNIVTWSPARSTTTSLGNGNFPNTTEAKYTPYSYNPGDKYYYPNNSLNINSGNDFSYTLAVCEAQGYTDCDRYRAGNYYNWSAAVASNDTSTITQNTTHASNSICPKSWRLPLNNPTGDFSILGAAYSIDDDTAIELRNEPLYFVRSGRIRNSILNYPGDISSYWSGTVNSEANAYQLYYYRGLYRPSSDGGRHLGFPVHCIAE